MSGAYRLNEVKELAIYTWVSSILGISAIWDKPDAPRPPLLYATLNISAGPREIGKPDERYKTIDIVNYTFRKVMTLTVNVYADNAHLAYMEKLTNSLALPTVQYALRAAGLAIWGHTDPLDISRLLDTKHEPRATVDVFLAYAIEADDTPGEIRKVSTAGTIGGVVTEQTIEIS